MDEDSWLGETLRGMGVFERWLEDEVEQLAPWLFMPH